MRRWLVIAIAAAVAGCSVVSPPPDATEFAKKYIEAVRTRDFAAIEPVTDPSLNISQKHEVVEKVASLFPEGQAKSINVISWQVKSGPLNKPEQRVDRYEFRFLHDYPNRPVLAEVVLDRQNGKMEVKGFRVFRPNEQFAQQNAFTLRNKPISSLVFLAYAAAVPIFILVVMVLCLRTPVPTRWKWAWVIFILLGFGKATLNWTSGAVILQLINVQLLGSGFRTNTFEPIFIETSIPFGAILFVLLRARWSGSTPKSADHAPPALPPAPQ